MSDNRTVGCCVERQLISIDQNALSPIPVQDFSEISLNQYVCSIAIEFLFTRNCEGNFVRGYVCECGRDV